jgi:hypothetical protein
MSSDYKRRVFRITLGQDLETLADNYLKKIIIILPFPSQYTFSLLSVANNKDSIS